MMKFFSYKDGERMYYSLKLGGFVKKDWDYGYYSIGRKIVEIGLLHKLTVSLYLLGERIKTMEQVVSILKRMPIAEVGLVESLPYRT